MVKSWNVNMKGKINMHKLNPEMVANWLMNEDGFGATDRMYQGNRS